MAPKDYVKRKPQARKRKPATRAKSTKPQKQTQSAAATPWARILLAVLIIAAFIYGLYMLQKSDVEPAQQAIGNSTQGETPAIETAEDGNSSPLEVVSDVQSEVPPLPPLPVLGEEEWDYIDALPEASVEVDATGPKESDREYIMQCGSFRTAERAEELKARLAFQGFESRVIESNGGKWHRVVLGPYKHKRDAEKDRHTLKRNDIQRCKIW